MIRTARITSLLLLKRMPLCAVGCWATFSVESIFQQDYKTRAIGAGFFMLVNKAPRTTD